MEKTYKEIPSQYNVGGTTIEVKMVERCDNNCVGMSFTCSGKIEIADKYNKDNKQSESSKKNTFYHEMLHTILDTMGEDELNHNEKFVSCLSSFLTEAMANAVFIEDKKQPIETL